LISLVSKDDETDGTAKPYLTAQIIDFRRQADRHGRSATSDISLPSLEKEAALDLKKLLAVDSLRLRRLPPHRDRDKFDITRFEIYGDPVAKNLLASTLKPTSIGSLLRWPPRLAVRIFLSLAYVRNETFVELGGSAGDRGSRSASASLQPAR